MNYSKNAEHSTELGDKKPTAVQQGRGTCNSDDFLLTNLRKDDLLSYDGI